MVSLNITCKTATMQHTSIPICAASFPEDARTESSNSSEPLFSFLLFSSISSFFMSRSPWQVLLSSLYVCQVYLSTSFCKVLFAIRRGCFLFSCTLLPHKRCEKSRTNTGSPACEEAFWIVWWRVESVTIRWCFQNGSKSWEVRLFIFCVVT